MKLNFHQIFNREVFKNHQFIKISRDQLIPHLHILSNFPSLLKSCFQGDLAEETMKLFYDCTFEIGELFVTILTFTNYFYIGSPVMPLAVNIHERKFKSSHSLFWARVLCDIPALAKYRCGIINVTTITIATTCIVLFILAIAMIIIMIIIITRFPIVINEAEPSVHLAVKAHAPNLVQFEGWVHR